MSFSLNDMRMGKNLYDRDCIFTSINVHSGSFDLINPIVLPVFSGATKETINQTKLPAVQPASIVARILDYHIDGITKANQLASYFNSLVIRFIKVFDKASLILPVYFGIPVKSYRIPKMVRRSQVWLFKIVKFHTKG